MLEYFKTPLRKNEHTHTHIFIALTTGKKNLYNTTVKQLLLHSCYIILKPSASINKIKSKIKSNQNLTNYLAEKCWEGLQQCSSNGYLNSPKDFYLTEDFDSEDLR